MDKEKVNVKVTGCSSGLATILTVIFVVAKLIGLVTWSWWLCFLPLIINVGLVIVLLLVIGIMIAIAAIIDRY